MEGVAILTAVLAVATVTASNDYSKEQQFRALNAVKEDILIKVLRQLIYQTSNVPSLPPSLASSSFFSGPTRWARKGSLGARHRGGRYCDCGGRGQGREGEREGRVAVPLLKIYFAYIITCPPTHSSRPPSLPSSR